MSTPSDVALPEAAQPSADAPQGSPEPSSARSELLVRNAAIGAAAMLTWWVVSWVAAASHADGLCPPTCVQPIDVAVRAGGILAVAGVIALTWVRGRRLVPWAVGSLAGLAIWLVIGAPVASLWLPVLGAGIVTWRTEFPLQRVMRVSLLGAGWLVLFELSGPSIASPVAYIASGRDFGSSVPALLAGLGPLFGLVLLEVITAAVWSRTGKQRSAATERFAEVRWTHWLAGAVAIGVVAALLWFPGRLPDQPPQDLAVAAGAVVPFGDGPFKFSDRSGAGYGSVTVYKQLEPGQGKQANVIVDRYGSPVLLAAGGLPRSPYPEYGWPLVTPAEPTGLVDFQAYAATTCGESGKCWWGYSSRMGQYTVRIDSGLMTEDDFLAIVDRVIAQLGEELS